MSKAKRQVTARYSYDDKAHGWSVVFDGPDVASWGRTIEAARRNGLEALSLALDVDSVDDVADVVHIDEVIEAPRAHISPTAAAALAEQSERLRQIGEKLAAAIQLPDMSALKVAAPDVSALTDVFANLRAQRAAYEVFGAQLADATRTAAEQLSQAGISTRDVAEIVGSSHQRVAQIVKTSAAFDKPAAHAARKVDSRAANSTGKVVEHSRRRSAGAAR